MGDRASAVRTIVEAMWEHAEEMTVSDLENPHADFTEKNDRVLLGTRSLVAIVRTLNDVGIPPDEVLAAVKAWSRSSGEEEAPNYRRDYLSQWQRAIEAV